MRKLIRHAAIHTMNPAMPLAEAAVVEGDRFAFVGAEAGAAAWLAGRPHEVIDAEGCSVIPGLNDAHLHFLHCAERAGIVEMEGARSIDECVGLLRQALAGGKRWIVGAGWNQERFAEKRLLFRQDLDRVSEDIPVIAKRACGHLATANSRALALAGIDSRDGVLRENEQDALWRLLPTEDHRARIERMARAQGRLFAQGITSIQSDDLGSLKEGEEEGFLKALLEATEQGVIRLRYAQQALCGDEERMRRFFGASLHRLRGERFQVSCMKLLADGSLGARTAALSSPYEDAPGLRGMLLYTQEELGALTRLAASHGMPMAIHAIGDAAMEQALTALRAEGRGLRSAIVHAQITDARQVMECGRLGVIIMAQPIFLKADVPIVAARVGSALANTSYRWKTMLGAGSRVAFSTDSPVEPTEPFANLYCAVARRFSPEDAPYLPEEGFSLEEALYAYTMAGAYATGEEREKGSIEKGKLADFALLSLRLREDAPEALLETRVRATFIGGEAVYLG